MKARIETLLPARPDVVWETVKRSSTLVYVARGMLSFDGAEHFPSRWSEGLTLDTRLRFFGVVPAWRHQLLFARVDDDAYVIQTVERGGLIRNWQHRIEVAADPAGTSYCDELDIEAGSLTPLVTAFARGFYRHRQRRLQALLAQVRH